MRMRACVLREPGRPVPTETVTLDPPRAGEVLVRVVAAGVCRSDVRLAEGELGRGRCAAGRSGRPTLCEPVGADRVAGTLMDGTSRLRGAAGEILQHGLTVACFAQYAVVAAAAIPIAVDRRPEKLELGDVVSDLIELDDIPEAFDRLRRGEGDRSVVILDRERAEAPA